jgi:hypothetical protein
MLVTGYNLVRGQAVAAFHEAFARRYKRPAPQTVSLVSLLRHIERRERLPHQVAQVTGLPALWRVCDDGDGAARMLFGLLLQRMNWMQNWNPYLYFVLPDEVTFNHGAHLQLRLGPDLYADMTAVFGHMRQMSSDHYHHTFTVSQV